MVIEVIRWLVMLLGVLLSPVITLNSVEKIDDHPLYVMQSYGDYERNIALAEVIGAQIGPRISVPSVAPAWACSLFAALGDPANRLYGRNFDWDYSPAVLLFTHPPDGYDSVSMVDIAYLGYGAEDLSAMPLADRAGLLYAPFMPFDGMNEYGLAVGMAAVSASRMPTDPGRPTIGSLGVIREVLDHARTVDEAVAIFEQVNIDMEGGPPLHYLIADASGQSVLIEFLDGQMNVQPNAQAWDMATNFIRSANLAPPEEMCWRYKTISERMADSGGRLSMDDAMSLLHDVSQSSITQWSLVYNMSTGEVRAVMRVKYGAVHRLSLRVAE